MAYEHTRKNYAHGIVGRIVQDDDPVNPRTDSEPLCRMTCWHRRYELGDEHRCADTRDLFETIAQLDGPHLYRDPDGRKLYGALSVPDITRGVKRIWWDIGFSLQESDHDRIIGEVTPA